MVPSLITSTYYNYQEIRPLLQNPCNGTVYKGYNGSLLDSGKGGSDKAGLSVNGRAAGGKCPANAIILPQAADCGCSVTKDSTCYNSLSSCLWLIAYVGFLRVCEFVLFFSERSFVVLTYIWILEHTGV